MLFRSPPYRRFGSAPALLLVWVMLVAVVLAGTETYLAEQRRSAVAEGLAAAEADVRAAEQYLFGIMDHVQGLHALARTRELLVAQRESGDAVAAIERHLMEVAGARASLVLQVAVIGSDGWLRYSTTPGWTPVFLGDREHFRVHTEGPDHGLFVSTPLIGRASGRWSVQLSRAITDADGRLRGVVVVSLDPVVLSHGLAALGSLRATQDNLITLLRTEDGQVLARSREPELHIGRSGSDRSAEGRAALQRGERSGATFGVSMEGREVLLAFRVIDGTSILAASAVDRESYLAPVTQDAARLRFAAAAALVLLLLVGVAAVLWAARRRAAATLEELDRTLTNLPFVVYRGAIAVDGAFGFLYLSPSVEDVTGWPRDPAAWTPAAWAERADPGARDDAVFTARLSASGAAEREYRLARRTGGRILVMERARVLRRQADGTLEIVGSLTDVTAAREVEAKAALAAKLATLGEMAAGMAHELNQPLAAMLLAAENAQTALRRGNLPGVEQRLEIIAGEAERARDIIDHLRIFARGDEGAPLGAVDPAAAVRGALLLVRAALREAQVAVELDLPGDLPAVQGRQVQLEQVLVNLLINARDVFAGRPAPAGGRRLALAGRRVAGGVVELRIRDNGGGVPPAVLDRIFDPFFSTKPPGEGTGIGLSICHGIVTAFGGTIACRNADGGAEFTITLPVAIPARPERDATSAVIRA